MALPPSSDLRLLVFDLDGTLIDSRQDLTNSVNAMLHHLGKPALPDAVITTYIGDGASMLVRRALGDPEGDLHDEEYVQHALTFFLDYYRVHKLDFTRVYDGVLPSLEAIRMAHPHLRMAILTNKPVNPSREISRALGLEPFFFENYGGNSFHTKKPDPLGLETLMHEAAATPGQTVMIGDSAVDILTAQNAGAWSIGCVFGLSADTLKTVAPTCLCDSPNQWVSVLEPR